MATLTPEPTGYIVIAEVVHGRRVAPIIGRGLFCSPDCAADEVRDLAVRLGLGDRGATFLARHGDRPVGVAVTRAGRMWVVQVHAYRELPTAL